MLESKSDSTGRPVLFATQTRPFYYIASIQYIICAIVSKQLTRSRGIGNEGTIFAFSPVCGESCRESPL